jgi:hypothetical protein
MKHTRNSESEHAKQGECKMTNQTDTETTERTVTIAEEFFYALMKNVGRAIDPAAAEVHWIYARTLDPYNVHPDLPPEEQQVGREYFACNPGSDIWVSFHDLPQATYEALRHKALNARPAWFNTPLGEAWKRTKSRNRASANCSPDS